MPARSKSRAEFARMVDRQLERYRSMRDFQITSEPQGNSGRPRSAAVPGVLPFVVQKHAARQLHYDFRLGWRGVLKSWAVAKGPSYFQGDKRLAVEVEDHPMEYGGFEGTIPKGQYGGGTVMVWDFGEWVPLGDADRELEKGNLKFELRGKKLMGKWALVRMKGNRDRDRSDRPNWLLIKERDEYAQPESAPSIIDLAPDSALTQRTMEQIAESEDHVWDSKQGGLKSAIEKEAPAQKAESATQRNRALARLLRNTPEEGYPGFVQPQLAQQARRPPAGDEWMHELKLDGYRIQVHVRSQKKSGKSQRKATLYTRTGLDWTDRMQNLARAAASLDVENCILDGEIVALDQEGRASFSDLQAAFQAGRQADLIYFAFDLLHLNGHNLTGLPLTKRKAILSDLLSQIDPGSPIRLSDHIEGRGSEVFAKACELGAEGIVSKLAASPYTSGRGNTWLKMKCGLQQEFVISGFTLQEKGGVGIGALLLGYYQDGKLRYAGRCGTGFSDQTHRFLRERLDRLVQKSSPFAKLPSDAPRKASWVAPELVAQVSFAAWTNDDLIRQSSFKGLCEDKLAKEVRRESPATAAPCSDEATREPSLPSPDRSEKQPARASAGLSGFRITHPQKVVDVASGTRKLQVAEYYLAVAEHILPHISDRPLSVVRCPDGIGKPCFFQKHIALGLPEGVNNISIPNRKTAKNEDFLTVNTVHGLIGLAQLGVLEIHPWGSKNSSVDRPDRIIFDLDPDAAIQWSTLKSAALELRARLNQLHLTCFVKTTGGKGLHVVIPIEPEYEWPIIKQFAHALVLQLEEENRSHYITTMTKAARTNKIYLDYLRNDREATAIAPFSTRARPGVPVAVPLDWNELESSAAPRFTVNDFARWKKRLERDPWKKMATARQRLASDTLRAAGVKLP